MKTQEFKNSESEKPVKLIMLVLMIIFCEILLTGNGANESKKTSKEITGSNFVMPTQQISFSKTVNQQLEKEKLYLRMKLNEDAINRENEKMKNTASEVEFSMAKLNDYLIVEEEPEMNANDLKSIVFTETEPVELIAENELSNASFLENLKIQAFEKTREAVELYALEKRVREYLTTEIEKPMELEDWMTNKKCWCPELRETMALVEEK